MKEQNTKIVDKEWMELIVEAKRLGLSKSEIRFFFRQNLHTENLK